MNLEVLIRTLWMRRQLMGHDRWPRKRVLAHQAQAVEAVRKAAYAHSPFYRQFHEGRTERPLQELPVLTKRMLMAQFDELVTDRAIRKAHVEAHLETLQGDDRYLGRYWVNATSGSTGQPGLFLFDAQGWATTIAAASRVYEWANTGFRLGHRRKMAIVASTLPWHMSARVGATLPSWWTPTLRVDARWPMAEIVEKLNAWQPETVVAYASMAAALAVEQQAGRLAIAPATVVVSSEVLTPAMRASVEFVWGSEVYEAYAATEPGTMASECSYHQGLHLMDDVNLIEVVDEDNRPVPPGTFGARILVTSLFNLVQPLIRYEISDMVSLASDSCPCGRPFPLIAEVQGRREEVLLLPDLSGRTLPIHPNVVHQALEVAPVGDWQVVHTSAGLKLLLECARDPELENRLRASLTSALLSAGAAPIPIVVEWVDALPRTRAGKAPLIRREV